MTTETRCRHRCGFTLIEMIIAIALLAIIAVISYRALDGVTRSRAALTEEMERTRALNQLFDQLDDDAAQVVGDRELHAPAVSFAPGRVRIVRATREDGQPLRWQIVEYGVEQGVIVRRVSPLADTRDAIAPWLDRLPGTAALPLVGGVAEMQVRAWVSGRGWITDMREARKVIPTLTVPSAWDAGTSGITGFEVVVRPASGSGDYVRDVGVRN